MATTAATVRIEFEGLPETLKAFTAYGKAANTELRAEAGLIAADLADDARAAALSDSPQAALIAPSIKVRKDRVPVVVAGGTMRVNPTRAAGKTGAAKKRTQPTAGSIFFGAEFGGRRRPTTQQFRPHRGTRGYFFYPVVRREAAKMRGRYGAVLDRLGAKWGTGGPGVG
jgi:hypothetical protein